MVNEHKLADPEDIGDRVGPKARKLLVKYIKREKDEYNYHPANGEREDTRTSKVTLELCDLINEMYDSGMTAPDIVDKLFIKSPNTVYYHAKGQCEHSHRSMLTYDECGWIRYKLNNGATTKALATLYNTNQKTIQRHGTGECGHDHGCETVTVSQLRSNGHNTADRIEAVCPVCDEQFEYPSYRDRVTCSTECNSVYANERNDQQATSD